MIRDMTAGSPAKTMVSFALPMILGNLFQQFYNIVDLIVVGNFVGASALAAVGASGSATFLFIALSTGGAAGCTVVISQFFGSHRMSETTSAVYTTLISMTATGALLALSGLVFGDGILRLMGTPLELFSDASVYLKIYTLALLFMFLYNGVTASFNALGDSRTPLFLLVFTSVLNIALDLLFVIRFGLAVPGVAWATLISQAFAAFAGLTILLSRLLDIRLQDRPAIFSAALFRKIYRIALPSMIQQSIVSMGFIFVQTLVNRYGPVLMAGYTAATKIDNIAILPMLNVGNALSAFTAQNMGAGKYERIGRGVRAASLMSSTIALALTAAIFLFGREFLGFFVDAEANAAVIGVGMDYLRAVSAFYIMMGMSNIFASVLRGAGDMSAFTFCTLTNFGLRIVMAYALAAKIGPAAIWWSLPIGWAAGLALAAARYAGGKWRLKGLI
ncbi:MATE family efflux transporter [Cloacibacillus sp.]|uniref:MATE family efflux transporter n=1 Tax=Cloacibacillus sp. TaxID=2049023 RepID=UPI0025BA910C|nr:MATE family efflux transporter [Cloacibacillus sp.]MCC8057816.1 MATE family efflux transporter [Cloacibacillus sp.]